MTIDTDGIEFACEDNYDFSSNIITKTIMDKYPHMNLECDNHASTMMYNNNKKAYIKLYKGDLQLKGIGSKTCRSLEMRDRINILFRYILEQS